MRMIEQKIKTAVCWAVAIWLIGVVLSSVASVDDAGAKAKEENRRAAESARGDAAIKATMEQDWSIDYSQETGLPIKEENE